MRKMFLLFLTIVSSVQVLAAERAPEVAISRIDCGRIEQNPMEMYDDTVFDNEAHRDAVASCYIIRHGSEFMLWDTGMSAGHSSSGLIAPKRSVKDILVEHGIKPEQIKVIGISHNHFDHLGQATDFPHAKLMIGAADWINLKNLPGSQALYLFLPPRTAVQPWLDNEANVEPLPLVGDKDIFGDGSVVMLNTPGHTPGHHSLLVRLKDKGAILLTGDLYEWQENFETGAVLKYATSRAEQLASQDRFKRIRQNLRATVIIQHEPADVEKLPAFPDWAR